MTDIESSRLPLFTKGKQVWRVRGKTSAKFEFWEAEEIKVGKMLKVGWKWDEKEGKWYRFSKPNDALAIRYVIQEMSQDVSVGSDGKLYLRDGPQ